MRIPLCLLCLSLIACGSGGRRGGSITLSDDGIDMGSSTGAMRGAEATLARSLAKDLGPGWTVQATLADEPRWDSVAESWRWSRASVAIAGTGPGQPAYDQATVGQAVRDWFKPRMDDAKAEVIVQVELEGGRGPVAVAAPNSGTRYTSQEGDTWAALAIAFHGDAQFWRRIAEANPHVDGPLSPGTAIVIPPAP